MISGWIFDVDPLPCGMGVWLIDSNGQTHRLWDPFSPSFYIGSRPSVFQALLASLSRLKCPLVWKPAERIDFLSGQPLRVYQIQVKEPVHFPKIVQWCIRIKETLEAQGDSSFDLFNCDLSLPQAYFFEKGSFPLAFCRMEVNDQQQIIDLQVHDSIWETDYLLPPLTVMKLSLEGESIRPDQTSPRALEVSIEGETYQLESENLIEQFNGLLVRYDPDILLSDWGDACLIPWLLQLSRKSRIPLLLNREKDSKVISKNARSYFSYGQVIHQDGGQFLRGRWHIDRQNSFFMGQTELAGLIEFSRLAKIPVQQMARRTPGTGISSMQMDLAVQEGILIPWRKREPEMFKTAKSLLQADKGGLIYSPKPGFYEEVGELDFESMFPTVMVRYNISPETLNCSCCEGHPVPETGNHFCKRRKGLIPKFLEPFLAKRLKYKQLKKLSTDPDRKKVYDDRQSALKWGLVCTFGYQGYKAARFGRIEGHEAINAFARDKLLMAKETAEAKGFTLVHAIVDSLWIQKPGATEADYTALAEAISKKCDIPIAFEGIYRWLLALPSRMDPKLGVANRYAGVFRSGELKIRGIEARRSDTPAFIRQAQLEMINLLAQANNRREYETLLPKVREIFEGYRERLVTGQVSFFDLAISKSLSKSPEEYQKDTLSTIVAKELSGRGVNLSPGQDIAYVITDEKAKVKSERARALGFMDGTWSYDAKKYEKLLTQAMEGLTFPFA